MKILCVRPSIYRELMPEELEVGWIVNGEFLKWAMCKNNAAFESLLSDVRSRQTDFELQDEREGPINENR